MYLPHLSSIQVLYAIDVTQKSTIQVFIPRIGRRNRFFYCSKSFRIDSEHSPRLDKGGFDKSTYKNREMS